MNESTVDCADQIGRSTNSFIVSTPLSRCPDANHDFVHFWAYVKVRSLNDCDAMGTMQAQIRSFSHVVLLSFIFIPSRPCQRRLSKPACSHAVRVSSRNRYWCTAHRGEAR